MRPAGRPRAPRNTRVRGPARLDPRFVVGVCSYNTPDFARAAAAGMRFVRTDNPNSTKVALIRAAGVDVVPIARYALGDLPSNASQGQIDTWASTKLALWSALNPQPLAVECMNEPWNAAYSDMTTNYALYVAVVKSFTTQAWAIWPTMRILVCGDTGPVAGWLDAVLAADTTNVFADARIRPSVHLYCEDRAPQSNSGGDQYRFRRYEGAYAKFAAKGHPNPQCWCTEFGWESNTSGSVAAGLTVTEAQQADYIVQGIELARNSGVVEACAVFGMMNATTPAYNLIRPDNSDKPALVAITAALRRG